MKRDKFLAVLTAEILLLTALLFLPSVFPKSDTVLTFPFEQIAAGLTALTRIGPVGAGLALALWLGVSLLPAIPAVSKTSGRTAGERAVLLLLSAVMLLAIYGMASPRNFLIPQIPILSAARSALGVSAWSVIALYAVVRLVGLFRAGDKKKLMSYVIVMLQFFAMLCAAYIVLACLDEMITSFANAKNSVDTLFSVLRFAVDALAYVLDIVVAISAAELLKALDSASNNIAGLTEKLTKQCCTALTVPMALTVAFNILQDLFMSTFLSVNISANIPVVGIVFTLLVLLAARLLAENKRLQDDNDLFI